MCQYQSATQLSLSWDDSVVVAPDSLHVDWITIPGGTVKQLIYAWRLDYHGEERPQRLVLVAGLNELLKGRVGNSCRHHRHA